MAEIRLTPEQQKVVDTRNCNLLVAAAAGSGKTAVLVKRIIKKVTEEGQDIDRLLIVTFTNAAAAEMRERIGAAIEEALAAQPDSAHLQRQMMLLHNAQITTIHSFCLSVIREFFHLLSLDPGFRIGDEAELSLLRSDVLEEVLEECYEKEEEAFLAFVESFGSAKNDDAVKEYILKLYNIAMSQPYANEWLDSLTEGFRIPAKEFGSHPMLVRVMQEVTNCLADCRAVLERLFALAEEPDGPVAYKENFQADEAELLRLSSAATDYVSFASALSELKFSSLSRKKQEASEEKKELAKSLRDHIKKQLKKLQEDFFYEAPEELLKSITHMELTMQGLVDATKKVMSRYEEQKKEKNLLDFNDLEHMALRILVERAEDGVFMPTMAAKTLSCRFDEIMIDEYQDSNLIQEAILTSVSGAWRDNPNVFMVGDVKQSIYRFRMACPDLFMEKYETYGTEGKAQKIDLAKNFRSRQGILDAINVLFAGLMHKESTEVEYDAAASLYFGASYPEEKSAHGTEVLFVNAETTMAAEAEGFGEEEELPWNSDEGAEDGSNASSKPEDGELGAEEKTLVQAEAYAVANRIKELISSDLTVGSEERGVGYGDIVILLRTMSGWSEAFLEVFAEQGIPAYADTSAGYFKTFEIRKTLDFLRILDNPKQDIPFAAVLHSPIGGFNAEELATLRVKYGSVSAENKTNRCLYAAAREAANNALGTNDGVNSKAAKFFELYDRLRAESEYISIHELIESFYRQSGFYDVVTVMPGGERRRGNLDMLVTRAKQYEATSFSGLYDFIRYIDRLIKYEVDFGEAGTVEAGQMVRIMSIHKSKGLEFPVVFLCGMEKKMNRMDMRDRLIIHSKLGLGPEFVDTALRVKSPTLLKKIIAKQMNEEMIAEELRVLYVAMTRAREKLILVGAMKEPEKRYAAWQQRSETVSERGLLSSYVSKANTYYDFVCPLLMAGVSATGGSTCRMNSAEDWAETMVSGVQVSITKHMETENFPDAVFTGRFILRECGAMERALQSEETRQTKQELLAVLEQMKTMEPSASEEAKAVRELLNLQNSFRYPYDTEANLPIKVTVSELKRMHLEADEQEGMDTALAGSNTGFSVQSLLPDEVSFDDIKFEDISFDSMDAQGNFVLQLDSTGELMVPEDDCTYPEFLKPEKTISGSDRGTISHHIMELIPFAANMPKNAVKATLDGMVKDGRLKQEDRDAVNDNKFVKFFASELGIRMCRAEDAGTLRREQPFVIGLPAKELYPDSESEEIVLVQGVIDAFFEEEDGIVLMDYKTDRIHEDAKAELTKKYQSQLKYYRRALEMLTGKEVKEVWFYAFGTGEDFRIE